MILRVARTATAGKSGPRPRQSATLRMVAREAGVSASTVSRIINGTVNVSDGLKHAVDAAIAKFDFRPNAAARGLALGKTLTIGVVAQAIDSPFYGEGLRGIEACLRHRGYAPLFMSGNWSDEDEDRCMQATPSPLESGVTFSAIFCVNDQTAYGACLALFRTGLEVPRDVSVVGFDDLPSSAYRLPPLTSVRQSIGELGEQSAEA